MGEAEEVGKCKREECPIDCVWQHWGPWSMCSKSCEKGTKSRHRVIKVEALFGGGTCSGQNQEELQCNTHKCPLDCKFSAWGKWAPCSQTCEEGTTARKRRVVITPAFGGLPCDGDLLEEKVCKVQECPLPCFWHWGDWTACTATCGKSFRSRTRVFDQHALYGGAECEGLKDEKNNCIKAPCPQDCVWENWQMATCSKTCGGGSKIRHRGTQKKAAHGGKPCSGLTQELLSCSSQPCPQDCVYSETWAQWSTCSKSCAGGTQDRLLEISLQADHGGTPCQVKKQQRSCSEDPCPVDCQWGQWDQWKSCSRSCGGGRMKRTRPKEQQRNGGRVCHGDEVEFRWCNENPCPQSTAQTAQTRVQVSANSSAAGNPSGNATGNATNVTKSGAKAFGVHGSLVAVSIAMLAPSGWSRRLT